MENFKFTPERIVKKNLFFSIPLYQRLFAWREKNITKLLHDLKNHFEKNADGMKPYHLGMLTTIRNGNNYDLVDGQQRFTVMMLLGISLRDFDPRWNDFLGKSSENSQENIRLDFVARSDDREYLRRKIEKKKPEYVNTAMEDGLKCINDFLEKEFKEFGDKAEKKEEFAKNIYENLTFFFTELPDHYKANPTSLNKYFEAMNGTGRNLEQHEILKVELLKGQNNQEQLNKIWNAVSQMNRPIMAQNEDVNTSNYLDRFEKAINDVMPGIYKKAINDVMTGIYNVPSSCADKDTNDSIENIKAEKQDFEPILFEDGEQGILKFPEFLLLVLDITLSDNKQERGYSFYQTDKLLENFKVLESKENEMTEEFYHNLLLFRLLLDYYVIRKRTSDGYSSYKMIYRDKKEQDNDSAGDTEAIRRVMQFQAMLDVSTSFYNWMKPYLLWLRELRKLWLDKNQGNINAENMLSKLKGIDFEIHGEVPDSAELSYGKINRYWFWRLDYELWEKRKEIFKDEERMEAVSQYEFKENRSIEHLHPQNETNNTYWKTYDLNSFGNLAMISQSFNSQQSNDAVEVKFARISPQMKNKALQSLKLYRMYLDAGKDHNNWNEEKAIEHEGKMVKILKEAQKNLPKILRKK